jgi:thioredoxin-related protein
MNPRLEEPSGFPARQTPPRRPGREPFRWQALLLVLFLALPGMATGAPSLLDFRLGDIRSGEMRSLQEFQGRRTFLVFFEPDCPWCVKQMRALEELGQQCPERIQTVTAGVHGKLPEYRRLLRVAGTDQPAFMASNRLVAAIGGVTATPYTLFLDARGQPTHRLQGYIPAPEMRVWLEEQGVACQ